MDTFMRFSMVFIMLVVGIVLLGMAIISVDQLVSTILVIIGSTCIIAARLTLK